MDFDSLFVSLQGALIGVQKQISTPLSQLDKESTAEINEVLKAVERVLENPEEQIDDCRRVHLLIILNTDFCTVPLVGGDDNYCHLLNTLPQFNTYLYFRIMVHFEWFDFLGEVIVHCPEALSLDVLKCVDTYLKQLEARYLITFLQKLYYSLFDKVIRVQNSEPLNKKHKFVKVFQSLMAFSISETIQSLDWKITVRQQFMGKVIRMFFLLLKSCVSRYNEGTVSDQKNIYNIMIVYDYSKWEHTNHEVDCASHCLNILISKCKKLSMEISIDMYMSWCGVDVENDKTLQTIVREAAYSCKESLNDLNVEKFPAIPGFISTIQNIALKPKSEDDEINSADIELIITNLKNPEKSREKWFSALLKTPTLFSNSTCISIMKENLNLLNADLTMSLISRLIYSMQMNSNNLENIIDVKNIIAASIKQLPLTDQVSLLKEFYENHGNTSILKCDNFDDYLTEILNKIVDNTEKKEELYPDFVWLSIQCGQEVIQRLLGGSLNSQEKCNISIDLLKDLAPLSTLTIAESDQTKITTFVAVQMLNSVENLLLQERDNYIYMVVNLSKYSLLDGQQYLNHVISQCQNSLSLREWDKLLFWLDVFLPFIQGSGGEGVIQKPYILLAFLVQILNKCRYKPKIFVPLSAQTCENCINLIHLMTVKLITEKNNSDSEVLWLKNMAHACSPLTWYHVKKLWTHWGNPLPKDDYDVLRWFEPNFGQQDISKIAPDERAKLVTSLCKILPMLTTCEWKILGNGETTTKDINELNLFHILADGILVLSQVPIMVKNISCFSQVVTNFLTFIKFRTVPAVHSASVVDIFSIFEKVTIITREIPEEVVKVRTAQFLTIMNSILRLYEEMPKPSVTPDIMPCIMSIKDEPLKSSLRRILQGVN